jgi:hypothetical protein
MNPIQRKANSVEMKNTHDHHGAKGGLRRLRRPRFLIYAAIAVGVIAALPVSAGAASSHQTLAKPVGLQTFKQRKNDARRTAFAPMPTFNRTPAFAWSRVRGAAHYEFELSTSKDFDAENGLVWSGQTGFVPTMSVPVALPWSSGEPHSASFYWRVRATNGSAVSQWSDSAPMRMGFTDENDGVPQQNSKDVPAGLIRWTKVDGATGYQVWLLNVKKTVSTITNVADLREAAQSLSPGSEVLWRVRAERRVYGETRNLLPAVTYGAWSSNPYRADKAFVTYLPGAFPYSGGLEALSDNTISPGTTARSHDLVPGFVFPTTDSSQYPGLDVLHRVYIATDADCVNIVHVGTAVSGNAYAPRSIGGGEPSPVTMHDGTPVTVSESVLAKSIGGSGSSGASPVPHDFLQNRAAVDLWDSDWSTGRYYWTVVPVSGNHDLVTPQDECQSGHVGEFKKTSVEPQLSDRGSRYVTGLSPRGLLYTARTVHATFYGSPLVAWTASPAAAGYDVQWTRTPNQWSSTRQLRTFATSAILPVGPGTWWYRVRGVNDSLPGNQDMRWTGPSRVKIVRPTLSVVGG